MSRSKRGQSPRTEAPSRDADPAPDRLRPWLLTLATALVVARALYPSESAADRGDGLPIVMLWIALVVFWFLGVIGRTRFAWRWGWTDTAAAILIALHSIASVFGAMRGTPRPALNMLWEWIGYGLMFFLLRQTLLGPREIRALGAVLVGLSVGLAGLGCFQYGYEMPATRAAYARNPDEALRDAGLWYEKGSPERKLFEDRLASREPVGTMALANSLAGVLAPWLIVGVGIWLAGCGNRGRALWLHWAGLACCLALVAACLLLTKSRSAWLATLLGLALLGLPMRPRNWRIALAIAGAGTVCLALLVVGAIRLRGLDIEVLSEAGKSLGYRAQYWQAAWGMIQDRPWWGVGPGNFQDDYTAYKLPQASEEVADPHNFLFEVWATAGTPALVALLAMLAAFGYSALRRRPETPPGTPKTADRPLFVLAGLPLGFLLGLVAGFMSEAPPGLAVAYVALPLAMLGLGVLSPWVFSGRLPEALPALAVGILLVNWLAAGGIGLPGVAGSLWVLMAMGLNQDAAQEERAGRIAGLAGLLVVLGLAWACYATAYRPVLESQARLREAQRADLRQEAALLEAAKADPFSADPWVMLSGLAFQRWQTLQQAATLAAFESYTGTMHRLAPNAAKLYATTGDRYAEIFAKGGGHDSIRKALAAYERAAALYPNSPVIRAKLALAFQAAGEQARFETEAARALELDELTPHLDKKLPQELRKVLLRNGSGQN